MYNILSFKVDKISGEAEITCSFDIDHNFVQHSKKFKTEQAALNYLESEKKSYIIHKLNKYVYHKKILSELANSDFRNVPGKLEALSKCLKAVDILPSYNLETICKQILKGEAELTKILPSPNSKDFRSSELNLSEILTFCKLQLK
jgi:hypothetical protein